jgi:hypothetical protein
MGRKVWGSVVGAILLFAEPLGVRLVPRGVLEFLGLAAVPDEIQKWGAALMWSLDHFLYWLPMGIGLAIICWANWGAIKMKIKRPAIRFIGVFALLVLSYFVSDISGQDKASSQQTTPSAPTLPPNDGLAQLPPQGFNNQGGIFIGGNNSGNPVVNNYGPPPPSIRVLETQPAKAKGDGTFYQTTIIQIVAASPPNTLLVAIKKDDLVESKEPSSPPLMVMSGGPFASGFTATNSGETTNGFFVVRVISPVGSFAIQAHTKTAAPIQAYIALNQ